MNCLYSIATIDNLNELVSLRVDFIKELHPEYSKEKLEEIGVASKDYIHQKTSTGDYIGFIGILSKKIVCCAGLLIYDLPPLQSGKIRKIGHVLNFYTKPEFRRKNYGQELMGFIIDSTEKFGFSKLVLNATADGYGLYKKAGFADSERSMDLKIGLLKND